MKKICYFGCDHISSSYTRHHVFFYIVVFFQIKGLKIITHVCVLITIISIVRYTYLCSFILSAA